MSFDQSAIFRILDANANRAAEGLRVVEEYLRFVLEDQHLSARCKQLRHDLQQALDQIPTSLRYAARDTESDVGTGIQTQSEYERRSARDVALAGQKRFEQALRCLEEYSKPGFPQVASVVEQLRYRAYTLARAIEITAESRQRLENALLYVLVDARTKQGDFVEFTKLLVDSGVSLIQLRDKTLGERELLARARHLRAITRDSKTLFIMNDRPDLALLAAADGVHVGQHELSVKDARTVMGPQALVGVSTHTIEQARQAVLDGANYIGCGPTFPSLTKDFTTFPGIDFLRQVANEITLPAFAIGGIDVSNLSQVSAAGFRRIAVQGAITSAQDPSLVVRQLLSMLNATGPAPVV
jgi:thiamine-phosphate pyrophosphorylase